MFQEGQKVVCVDATSPAVYVAPGDRMDLRAGMVLTISATTIHPLTDTLALQFSELPSQTRLGARRWYQAKRFRPIVEHKTNISVFTALLSPSKVDA